MPDEDAKPQEKTLEMRVAELEDKLSRVHITEEELQAYHKVSALLAGGGAGGISPGAALSPKETAIAAGCVVDCSGGCISECTMCVRPCIIRACIIRPCIIRQCWAECVPGAPGGGMIPGQFGGLGF